MDILLFNAFWMAWNIFLACVGLFLSWCIWRAKQGWSKLLLLPLWLAFVPNTIYIVTDVIHLPSQLLYVEGTEQLILIAQYAAFLPIGVATFYMSMRFFEKGIRSALKRFSVVRILGVEILIAFVNFMIAFGVMMGRVERTNSWYLITDTNRVFQDALTILTSGRAMSVVFMAGVLYNILYFALKKHLARP